jgi:transcriptional regulator GlxA family with amidase domain
VFDVVAGARFVAVRFRPAMAAAVLGLPGSETTDRTEAWSGGRELNQRLLDAVSDAERVAVLASALSLRPGGVVQRLALWMSQRHGAVGMDELARLSGYESRQLRRLFLRDVGVTPKHLARILRFRRAAALASKGPQWASIAVDCGYYDQAHLSRDFRELAGTAPEAWRVSVFSTTVR